MYQLYIKSRILLLILLQFGFVIFSYSQVNEIINCQTSSISVDYTNRYLNKTLLNHKKNSNVIDTIYIEMNVVRENGMNEIFESESLNENLEKINNVFSDINMFFEVCSVKYFDRTDNYTTVFNTILNQFEFGLINIISTYGSQEGSLSFVANNTSDDLRYIQLSTMNTTVFIHEIGHYFGLQHTHGKYNYAERSSFILDSLENGHPFQVYIEGAVKYKNRQFDDNNNGVFDCEETGDNICDTPASTILSGKLDCTQKLYTAEETDYFGDKFSPLIDNYMSYGGCGDLLFTEEQKSHMRSVFDQNLEPLKYGCRVINDLNVEVTNHKSTGIGSFFNSVNIANANNGNTFINFSQTLTWNDTLYLGFDIYISDNTVIRNNNNNRFWIKTNREIQLLGDNIEIDNVGFIGSNAQSFLGSCRLFNNDKISNITFNNMVLDRCNFSSPGGSENIVIKNSNFRNSSYNSAVSLRESNNILLYNNKFQDNNIGLSLIFSRDIDIGQRNNIQQNRFDNNLYQGIDLIACTNVNIVGNIFINDTIGANQGINAELYKNLLIESNTLSNCKWGIDIGGNRFGIDDIESENLEIVSNTFNSNYTSLRSTDELYLYENIFVCNITRPLYPSANNQFVTIDSLSNQILYLSGPPDMSLDIYTGDNSCGQFTCDHTKIIGSDIIPNSGHLSYNLNDIPYDTLTLFSVIGHGSTNSTTFSSCYSPKEVNFGNTTSSSNVYNDVNIKISPNPTDSSLSLDYTENFEVSLSIFDISGKLYRMQTEYISGSPIDLNDVASGLYILHIHFKGINKRIIRKFVKN